MIYVVTGLLLLLKAFGLVTFGWFGCFVPLLACVFGIGLLMVICLLLGAIRVSINK